MDAVLLTLQILSFGVAWWLGWYLLSQEWERAARLFAGLSLLEYAVALATDLLARQAPSAALLDLLLRLNRPVLLLPILFWLGTLLFLLPEENSLRRWLAPLARPGLIALAVFIFLAGSMTNLLYDYESLRWTVLGYAYIALVGAAALVFSYLVLQGRRQEAVRLPLALVWVATIFVTLGLTLVLLPVAGRWAQLFVLSIGIDLLVLGVGVASLEAFSSGETVRLDMARSFGGSLLAALLFGLQVGMAIYLVGELTWALLLLLLATVATAILLQTMSDSWQTLLDRLVLLRLPALAGERQALRETASALSRTGPGSRLAEMSPAEFARLTRRALGQMGDLPRLASSPLIYLPEVSERVRHDGNGQSALGRAAMLKQVLGERIAQLKPAGPETFGTTAEWRHYNALHFP
ncbi:MAG: hypothetical protein KDE09_18830, partial [Anaerolineales bacterium]|nr:hypothetical protein [Anaerolineales bacterium]